MSLVHLKHLLRDERVWCVAARVEVLDGQSAHFDTNAEGDLIVSCLTVNHDVPIWANLDSLAGGANGEGVWFIPDPGTEVMIAFDDGDFEGEAHIVSRTSGGRAPAGLGPGKIFVIGARIEVRATSKVLIASPIIEAADAEGGGQKLALLSELDDLRKYVRDQFSVGAGHIHAVAGAATTTIATAAAGAGAGAGHPVPVEPATPIGTAHLKGD